MHYLVGNSAGWMLNGGNARQMLYEELPLLGNKIETRRMKLAGHCHQHPELAACDLVLWQPNQNLRRREKPKVDIVELLRQNAGNLTKGDA